MTLHKSTIVTNQSQAATDDIKNSQMLTGSTLSAARVVAAYTGSSIGPKHLMNRLNEQAVAVRHGDLSSAEAMLVHQAIALQSMFADLATRAKNQDSLQGVQTYTQLALRCQGNCRATLQTLAEIKNPRQVAFVKQTNVAQNQQVNNGTTPTSRTRNIKSAPNELLVEESDGSQDVDSRAAPKTVREDQRLDAVAGVDRAKKPDRQSNSGTKRI